MSSQDKRSNYRYLIPIDKCTLCEITADETDPSFIEVDHQDRDHSNNEISNLWALCKFCHNIKSKYENHKEPDKFWVVYLGSKEHIEIKKLINIISLEYFDDESTLKDHNSIYRMHDKKLEFVRKRNIDFIEKKKEKFFEMLDIDPLVQIPKKRKKTSKKESYKMPKNYITEKEWVEAKSKQEKHQEFKKSVHEKIMRGLKNI